jgi:hypothetical protein
VGGCGCRLPGFNLGSGKSGNVANQTSPFISVGQIPVPQWKPQWLNGCTYTNVQGIHTGGIEVAMGDGSARFVTSFVSQNSWQSAVDALDSAIIGDDF